MKKNRSLLFQKLVAGFFVLVFIVSFIFIGYRIYTKPAYEAHETEQARLLAISTISLLSEKTSRNPGMWAKFESSEIKLIIDHMKIKGNWVVEINILKKENHIEVFSLVSSGWNSRSPLSAKFRAKIYKDGRLEYVDGVAALTAAGIVNNARQKMTGKIHNFKFPNELKKVPAPIDAEESIFTDPKGNEFLILKEPLKTALDGLQSE